MTVIPISNEAHADYAWKVAKELRNRGVRVDVDERNEKMQYKIRQSQTHKVPYQLIVGDKEQADGTVTVSYTHLDVYKRQEYLFSFLKISFLPWSLCEP